jgi:predicted N-acyltransferase
MRHSRTEIVNTTRELVAEEWDAVTSGHILAHRGWLRAIEDANIPGIEARYVIARDGSRPAGAAVCYFTRGHQPGLNPDDLLLGELKPLAQRIGFSFSPALVVAPFRGYDVPLLGTAREALLGTIEMLARRERLAVHIPRVPEDDTELCRLLLKRGYHRTSDQPIARLDIRWDTFDGYLKSLKNPAPRRRAPPGARSTQTVARAS